MERHIGGNAVCWGNGFSGWIGHGFGDRTLFCLVAGKLLAQTTGKSGQTKGFRSRQAIITQDKEEIRVIARRAAERFLNRRRHGMRRAAEESQIRHVLDCDFQFIQEIQNI
ncbi:MAG: hypothetical protein V4710_22065 [Verrucomicrobiota bacterium]